ncbi:MAG: 7-cyano-7-deazaguanine synthase QueC [Tissierellaceae bacterium]|nr:7-cyano-7-deazaguanine synthase QueC [Tissierellaceae bacterium]
MSKKALVLNSGGVDSTTCLSVAIDELGLENVSTVSVFYGQKHSKELECAKKIADYYGVKHYELDLSAIFKYSNCSLLSQSTEEIIHESYAEQIAKDGEGMVRTYVPFRNGLMLSAVATLAVSIYPDDMVDIYLGAHADDSAGRAYADCSEEFTNAIGQAINIGTYEKVNLRAPLVNLSKAEVVREGLKLGTPYELTWSCYEGGETPCGTCGTCIDRAMAFKLNNISDPAL